MKQRNARHRAGNVAFRLLTRAQSRRATASASTTRSAWAISENANDVARIASMNTATFAPVASTVTAGSADDPTTSRTASVTGKRCRQCLQPAHADRDYFCIPRRHRLLREVKELTAEDWAFIWIAYQGFLAQVNLIVQRAKERPQEAPDAT